MALYFRYKSIVRPDGNAVKTPSIPITISGESNLKIEVIALLDSGADVSIIPLDIAELLRINISGEKSKSKGIGGEVEVINTKITVNIRKGHEGYNLIIPVQVIKGDSSIPIILGRAGFFDKFQITFDQFNERIILKKTSLEY